MGAMFENAKKGDKVFHITLGWMVVADSAAPAEKVAAIQALPNGEPAPSGARCVFDFHGKYFDSDINPMVYWDEVKIDPPPRPKEKVTFELVSELLKTQKVVLKLKKGESLKRSQELEAVGFRDTKEGAKLIAYDILRNIYGEISKESLKDYYLCDAVTNEE